MIGLSRTGTTTISKSLDVSGYKILHYPRSFARMKRLHPYGGATDIPVCAYYKTLDQIYPNSKFIYTIREEHSWQDSIVRHVKGKETPTNEWSASIREMVYGSATFNEDLWFGAYKRHHDDVMKYFDGRTNDLLVLDIIGGDKPSKVYEFLGIDDRPLIEFGVYNKGKSASN